MTEAEKIEKLEKALRPFIVFATDLKGVAPEAVVVRSKLNINKVLYFDDFLRAKELYDETKAEDGNG